MMVISAREFRENQSRVLTAAKNGQTIVLTSRLGSFKITPVSETDRIIRENVRSSMDEVKAHMEGKKSLPQAKDVVF